MSKYLDTSLLVSALTREAATERVQIWLHQQDPSALVISDWVSTEFASALSMKIRMSLLRVEDRAIVAGAFNRLKSASLTGVMVSRDHFAAAARYADQFALALRAGDALHVAIAAEQGATLCTLDTRLARAATTLGVNAALI